MPTFHQSRVLIVDDDPEFGAVAKDLIEIEGCAAELAASAREALELAATRRFDVVLLDLMLGEASGLDVLRELRARDVHLPVIVVTAHGSMESAAEAVQADAFDYLGKPFRVADLTAALHRAIEWRAGRRQQSPAPVVKPSKTSAIIGRSPVMVAV